MTTEPRHIHDIQLQNRGVQATTFDVSRGVPTSPKSIQRGYEDTCE